MDAIEVGTEPKVDAVDAAVEQYEGHKTATQELDKFFVWPEDARPDVNHDQFDDVEIPVIDLSPVQKLYELRKEAAQGNGGRIGEEIKAYEAAAIDVQKKIRDACETYGFFQIVNHGFPMELVDQMTECYRKIFDLPLEEKMKVVEKWSDTELGKPGYTPIRRSTAYTRTGKSHIWNEGFDMESPELMFPGRLEELSKILYPEGSEKAQQGFELRSCAEGYGKQSSSLCYMLLDLMAASLKLPEKSMEELLGCSRETQILARLRVNHYPVCSQPDLTWGIHNHTDATVITVLHQDAVGGLQISFKDGSWHGLRPIPGAFVVNVGDFLQAWTNGRFISAEHRVVTNDKRRRFSIAYFALNQSDNHIAPRPELVDVEHPALYKPFTQRQYFESVMAVGLSKARGQVRTRGFSAEG